MSVAAGTRTRARRSALQALYQWQVSHAPPEEIERQFLAEQNMRGADLDYFRALLHGVPPEVEALDRVLAPVLDRPVAQVDPVSRAILRLATFELLHRADVPWRVIIDEAIELARVFGAEQSHRYVNGILDRIARGLRPPETDPGSKVAGGG